MWYHMYCDVKQQGGENDKDNQEYPQSIKFTNYYIFCCNITPRYNYKSFRNSALYGIIRLHGAEYSCWFADLCEAGGRTVAEGSGSGDIPGSYEFYSWGPLHAYITIDLERSKFNT